MLDILKCVASASELIQQSDLYMTVKAVLFTTPTPNLNGVRCTEAFIDEIVANQDAYVGLPLNADIRNLESGQYNKLGHMFDSSTGTFATAIIGSFYKFEKAPLPNGDIGLIGYARIMKRNQAVCTAVGELFASGNLKFSFEISCGSYTTLEDGTMLIDASKDNYLEGMCIVWSPACPEAVAKELVAELTNDRKEADEMHEESAEVTAEVVETEEVKTEEVVAENKEPEVEAEVEVKAETEELAEKTASENKEETPVDDECDNKEESVEEAQCKKKCAEDEEVAEEKTEEVQAETVTETASEAESSESGENNETKEVAAEINDGMKQMLAEIAAIAESIKTIKAELEELKATKNELKVNAQIEEVNGFMDNISVPASEKKYSLLEKDEPFSTYTLLEKN